MIFFILGLCYWGYEEIDNTNLKLCYVHRMKKNIYDIVTNSFTDLA